MRTAFLLLVAAAWPSVGYAGTVNFCIYHTGSYDDNDAGDAPHDYWTNDTAKAARGAWVTIYRGYYPIFDDYLGDTGGSGALGCTGDLTFEGSSNSEYLVYLRSTGHVNGNTVSARYDAGTHATAIFYHTVTDGDGSENIVVGDSVISPSSSAWYLFNVYQAGAWSLYRHAGGISGETLYYNIDEDNTHRFSGGEVELDYEFGSIRKFVIAHETGHWIAEVRTGGVMGDASDYGIQDGTCPTEPNASSNHSMRSEEWAGAAASEGWAHFYAADVWNDHGEDNCGFEYYKEVGGDDDPTVDCESANGDFPRERLDADCGGTSQHGVELDWLRQFWDVHTNSSTVNSPHFTTMSSWLETAGSWSRSDVYTVLDAEANDVGGDLNTYWDSVKDFNGVNH
jgi:hypothetical protein